jgi:GR25 family glycosyltransferase involved in LPS biosynthesis
MQTMDQNANAVGCWRAHMDALRKIVHEDVQTAVIFEDDADWDVSLKQQMVQFARGARYITNTSETASTFSPYGNNWDILWIGHCGTWFHEEDNRRVFVIPNDPTVEPPEFRNNVDMPDMTHWEGGPEGDNSTRIIFNSMGGVCTAAYAISQQGARKALYHMSMLPYNLPVDWGFAGLCADRSVDFICVSIFPQLVGVSRPTANTAKWSDIGYGNDDNRMVEEANALHIVYSTRLNMAKLLDGDTVFDSQYPDLRPPLDIQVIGAAVGHIEVIREENVAKPKSKDKAGDKEEGKVERNSQ